MPLTPYQKEHQRLMKIWKLSRKDLNEIITAELISVTGGVGSGILLALFMGRLELIPAIFIVLPGFLEMRGSIGGSLSARLSAGLFLKKLRPEFRSQPILKGNIIASFLLATALGLALGGLAYALELFLFGINFWQIIPIMFIGAILSNLIEIPATIWMTFSLFRKGIDPNNIMGPHITTLGDIISIISILLASALVL